MPKDYSKENGFFAVLNLILTIAAFCTIIISGFHLYDNGVKDSADLILLLVVLAMSAKLTEASNGKDNQE